MRVAETPCSAHQALTAICYRFMERSDSYLETRFLVAIVFTTLFAFRGRVRQFITNYQDPSWVPHVGYLALALNYKRCCVTFSFSKTRESNGFGQSTRYNTCCWYGSGAEIRAVDAAQRTWRAERHFCVRLDKDKSCCQQHGCS